MKIMLLIHRQEEALELRAELNKLDVKVVEWATQGIGWISAWQKAAPDWTWMDMQLPERDGLHCLKQVRSLVQDHPVAFSHDYQGNLANDTELKALALGATVVVPKSFVQKRLPVVVAMMREAVFRRSRTLRANI
jgi:CheY-like chemotaxis protein